VAGPLIDGFDVCKDFWFDHESEDEIEPRYSKRASAVLRAF
jgi:hypothetical protein